jgi:inorganic pyrophosphatase
VRNYTDVQANLLREIEHFLSIYRIPKGRRARVLGWKDRRFSHETIRASRARFGSGAPGE